MLTFRRRRALSCPHSLVSCAPSPPLLSPADFCPSFLSSTYPLSSCARLFFVLLVSSRRCRSAEEKWPREGGCPLPNRCRDERGWSAAAGGARAGETNARVAERPFPSSVASERERGRGREIRKRRNSGQCHSRTPFLFAHSPRTTHRERRMYIHSPTCALTPTNETRPARARTAFGETIRDDTTHAAYTKPLNSCSYSTSTRQGG